MIVFEYNNVSIIDSTNLNIERSIKYNSISSIPTGYLHQQGVVPSIITRSHRLKSETNTK